MAEYSGLVEGVTEALIGTYRGAPVHAPGRVFTDLAVAVADGADAISGITCSGTVRTCSVRSPRCRPLGGCWTGSPRRTSRRSVPPEHGRGQRRGPRAPARTWRRGVCLDFDATITFAHSEK